MPINLYTLSSEVDRMDNTRYVCERYKYVVAPGRSSFRVHALHRPGQTPPPTVFMRTKSMFRALDSIFPADVNRLILIFEGRIEDAWIKTYVASHYRRTLQQLFGWRFSFYQALTSHPLFYANALANCMYGAPRKKRIPRKFIAPYLDDIARYSMSHELNARRVAYAKRHKTLFHVYIGRPNVLVL